MNQAVIGSALALAIIVGYYATLPPPRGSVAEMRRIPQTKWDIEPATDTAPPTRSIPAAPAALPQADRLPPEQEARLTEALAQADAMAERMKAKLSDFNGE